MARTKLPWETDPIEFLIRRKFPQLELLSDETRRSTDPELEQKYQELLSKKSLYLDELALLGADRMTVLFESEKNNYITDTLERVEAFDSQRFFSEPYSDADLDYWSKISFWNCDEAVALSLGKDPRLVTWSNIEEYSNHSTFVYVFAQRKELIRRAIEAGQLFEKNTPSFFLAWALRTRFYMPDQIIQAVLSLGEQVADWKTEYDHLMAFLSEHAERNDAEKAALNKDRIEAQEAAMALYSELTKLSQEHEYLKSISMWSESAQPNKNNIEIGMTERTSMLKLIIGMAIKGYAYDPKQNRSISPKEISDDLALIGISLSDDTVRKYLREAAEHLPPQDK